MSRILGIDYGTKRIGLALSDEGQTLAFPKEIIANDAKVFEKISSVIKEDEVARVVIGESTDFTGEQNKIAEEISVFVSEFKQKFDLPVNMQKEFLTSVEARRYQEGKVDASAAALILQRYLDKINTQK